MSKKVLLCAVNSKFIHSNPAVYGLKAYYEKYAPETVRQELEVTVREYTINDVFGNIVYDIVSHKPDMLAFSVYIWNVETVKKLLSDLRLILSGCVFVLGGPEVSFGVDHCGILPGLFDCIIEGEGELCFKELLCDFAEDKAPERLLRASRQLTLEELPFTYNEENIGLFKNRILYYETSRGCPFSCAYCLSGGDCSPVRFLPIERVFCEIDFFVRYEIPLVKLVDRTFNCNRQRTKEILGKIASLPSECKTCFHFEVGADLFDGEMIRLLSGLPAGRVQLEAGIQSTNPKTLESSVRRTDNRRVFENIIEIVGAGNINVHTDLIAGLPYEDMSSFRNSFNEVYSLRAHQLQLGFLKRLQGSPLCSMQEEHGMVFSQNPPYEIICNNYISFAELLELKRVEAALERYHNSGYYRESLLFLESCFDTPYGMYLALADFLEESGGLFCSVSKRRAFDLFFDFGCRAVLRREARLWEEAACGLRCDAALQKNGIATFARMLLLDYFSSDKSELPSGKACFCMEAFEEHGESGGGNLPRKRYCAI